jgi:RHS repeat-associated protein
MHFTGKERDSESGLDYFGARYFSADQGRFTTPDWSETPQPVPYADLKDPQTLNLYTYVRNNPLSRTDPDGHCCWDELVSAYNYVKSVAYVKLEGGRGLEANVRVGPARIELGGKNTTEVKYASPESTKSQVGEIGVKMEVGPAKLGLAYESEKRLATNDTMAPADEKTESQVVLVYDVGEHGKGSGWDIGIGVGAYALIGGGIEIGVNGQKIANDLINLVAPSAPPPPAPPPPPPPKDKEL